MSGAEPYKNRPPFCVEENCELLMNPQSLSMDTIRRGFSGVCCGKAKDVDGIEKVVGEAVHRNYVYFCIYTPFKGWTKFELDEGDVFAIELCMQQFRKAMKWER